MGAVKNLVIVESPSKGKTIARFLGKDYLVKASFGHIRDLPKSSLGFDPDDNFKPAYRVIDDKRKVVKELRSYIDKDTTIYLAADEDREGEAIAWHLIPSLGIENNEIKRIVFHEITEKAILHALDNPVELNTNLVDAQQARRILDRGVGYGLSPLLWTKIRYGLSAGRVQSAAVKIMVDREREILAFDPKEYWKIKLNILSDPSFKAELSKIDNKKSLVETKEHADIIKNDCSKGPYSLDDVNEKESKRNPSPPFTTSTIQQAAASKLGFNVKRTMTIAQKLYEGSIRIPNHTGGLITYMRTDAVNLSTLATDACKSVIGKTYGQEYTLPYVRKYKSKVKGAQEAHEAIRPVDMSIKPSDIESYLDKDEYKLYKLIWSRTIATQMAEAKVSNTTYKITNGKYEFTAKGTKILFPGFLKAYDMGNDSDNNNDDDEKFLPNVPKGTVFNNTKLEGEQHYTKPPARYTEASLVKKLEAEGIGRPATFASTITTIMTRGYVEKTKDKKLAPTLMGEVVTKYLEDNFPNIVDLRFTANIEDEFDKIAEGKIEWQTVMHGFYDSFIKTVDSKKDGERVQYSDARSLGMDKETGLEIFVKSGQFGSYIQVGETSKDENGKKIKPHKISPLPMGVRNEDVTLEDAYSYLRVPRTLGEKDGKKISVGIGKFGPFVTFNGNYYGIKGDDDVYTIELPRALELIEKIDKEKAGNTWWHSEEFGITVLNGRFGPYIRIKQPGKKKGYHVKIPKDTMEASVRKMGDQDIFNLIEKKMPNLASGLGFEKEEGEWRKQQNESTSKKKSKKKQ